MAPSGGAIVTGRPHRACSGAHGTPPRRVHHTHRVAVEQDDAVALLPAHAQDDMRQGGLLVAAERGDNAVSFGGRNAKNASKSRTA